MVFITFLYWIVLCIYNIHNNKHNIDTHKQQCTNNETSFDTVYDHHLNIFRNEKEKINNQSITIVTYWH